MTPGGELTVKQPWLNPFESFPTWSGPSIELVVYMKKSRK